MERRAGLAILVLTLRRSADLADAVLDRYEAGEREDTFPRSLARAFRAVEHDARTMDLPRLAEFALAAKEAVGRPLEAWDVGRDLPLFRRVLAELRTTADRLDGGTRHRLDKELERALSSLPGQGPRRS